ncbi:HD-GYP domain-containing protein [Bradyrhizobium sp.]|jgi:putative nucleotidyltransferase with HDIG domain|uniref:HD-GYP domain-containing protein n=1 Tax=Bradyrhizobium sp. TaxID=376 RepID=UPI003D123550
MLVHFVTDEPSKIAAIRAMLEPRFDVIPQLLGTGDAPVTANGVLMVDADLRMKVRVEQIRLVLQKLSCISEKLFVVRNQVRCMVEQAYALGATDVISRPKEIVSRLVQIAETSAQTDVASPEIVDSAAAFASLFSAIRNGKPLNLSDAELATSQVIHSIAQNGLGAWLDDVRRYHQGTFQHCLLVTGVAVGFAMDIGFDSTDVKRLGIAATLHDIGKARIPLTILDKPGRLDLSEEDVMRRHPVIGYELLKDIPNISPEVLDGVRHHHEYLDGSGYPDALKATQISDLVRLLTISDIFAALIESRPYRPAMPRPHAYKILCGMDGQLERSLVKAFRNAALVT